MVRVKICGTTNIEDIHMCVECGADALGFVVEYPIPVPWNLSIKEADELMRHVPLFVTRVAVVGGNYEKVLEIAEKLRPDVIQLHGDEPIDETERIVAAIKSYKIKIIKAIRFSYETGKLVSEIDNPIELCNKLKSIGVDAVLLDSKSGNMPAGTGKTVNWEIASKIRNAIDMPLILAGGLNPENVDKAVSIVKPYAVDVISGVEAKRGKKSYEKVKNFIKRAKGVG